LLLGAFAVVIVAVTFALNARPSGGEPAPSPSATTTPFTPPERPAGVPASAAPVIEPYDAGTTAVIAPADQQRLFFRLECTGELLVIATTRETVYAALPCADYNVTFDAWEPLLAQPVRVRIEPGRPYRLAVEAAAATALFQADGVWIREFR
jgi:hypothetical protein